KGIAEAHQFKHGIFPSLDYKTYKCREAPS
ncbi:unnamed protein product, partial [marine sediment metagenome]